MKRMAKSAHYRIPMRQQMIERREERSKRTVAMDAKKKKSQAKDICTALKNRRKKRESHRMHASVCQLEVR